MSTTQIAEHAQELMSDGVRRTLSPWHKDAIITARRYARQAVERLVWLMDNADSHNVQLQAASAILDRALGKAHQSVSVEGAAPRLLVVVVDAAAEPAGGDAMPAIDVTPDDAGAVSIEPMQTKIPDFP